MARYSRNDQAGVELPKAKLDRENLKQALELFRYLRPYRGRFMAGLAALLVTSLLALSFPYLAGSIIDAALHPSPGRNSMAGADRIALLLMGVLALQGSLSFFHALSFATVGQRSLVDLRRDTYARLISLPMTFFAQRRVGELASRLSSDLIQIEDTVITILPMFLRQTTTLVGGIVLIALTSLQLTGIMLASLPIIVAAAVFFGRKTRKISRQAQDRLADTATVVEETLQGILNVKAFSNEAYELNRYDAGLGLLPDHLVAGRPPARGLRLLHRLRFIRIHCAGALVRGAPAATGGDYLRPTDPFRSLHGLCGRSDGAVCGVIQPASESHRRHPARARAFAGDW